MIAARWPALAAGALCLALAAAPARAQSDALDPHAAQPERPSVATHAGTVAPGWLEIEAGVERDRLDAASSWQAPLVAKIGLASHVQLTLQAPVALAPAGATGIGDLSVGVKWRLIDHHPVLGDFAVLPSVKLPTGDAARGTGTGTTDGGLVLISSRNIGDVSLDLNLGYTRRSGDGTAAPKDATLWTASFGGPVRGALGWGAELFGLPATTGPAGADSVVACLLDATFEVRPWWVLDAGVTVPLTGPQPKALFAGLTYNIGRIAPRR